MSTAQGVRPGSLTAMRHRHSLRLTASTMKMLVLSAQGNVRIVSYFDFLYVT